MGPLEKDALEEYLKYLTILTDNGPVPIVDEAGPRFDFLDLHHLEGPRDTVLHLIGWIETEAYIYPYTMERMVKTLLPNCTIIKSSITPHAYYTYSIVKVEFTVELPGEL